MAEDARTGEVHLFHAFLPDLRLHTSRSPDMKGLYGTSKTESGARQEAMAQIDFICGHRGIPLPRSVRFEEATDRDVACFPRCMTT